MKLWLPMNSQEIKGLHLQAPTKVGGGGGVEAHNTIRSRCGFKPQRGHFYFEETEDEETTCMPPQCTWKKQMRKKTKMKRQMRKKMKMKKQNEDEDEEAYEKDDEEARRR